MQGLSHTEEQYLYIVFKITERNRGSASTNDIAKALQTTAASVTDMIKRLSEKAYLNYKKYHGVQLSAQGVRTATQLIRNKRLWKVFLNQKLHIPWDRINHAAEQLKHIHSDELIFALSQFLGDPKYDPHGEAIPNAEGKFTLRKQISLFQLHKNQEAILVGVRNHESEFLQFLHKTDLVLGCKIKVLNSHDFDFSKEILVNDSKRVLLSAKICHELYVRQNLPSAIA